MRGTRYRPESADCGLASPLARLLADVTGASTDRAGRIAVLPDLSLPGHPEVFAVGDMAMVDQLPGDVGRDGAAMGAPGRG
jgi:NADH dehydrogenase FAD-containing subunit